MTIKTVIFQQTFPTGPYMNQRLGVEIGIDELDIVEPQPDGSTRIYTMEHLAKEAFHRAKAIVDEAFKSMNPSIATDFNTGERVVADFSNHIPGLNVTPPPKEINLEAERVAILIENAGTYDELLTYWPNAHKYGLSNLYELKLKELS